MKDVLTTGTVARVCRVCLRTVARWIDTGRLPAYRVPGSCHRRVRRESLVEFMRREGLPQQWIEEIEEAVQ